MNLHDLVFAAVLLLGVTAVCVALFQRMGLGSVLGFLAAGILVGPSGFDISSEAEKIREIAELGVVFLLFIIGLELHPRKLWAMRRNVLGLGTLQVLVTAAFIIGFMGLVQRHPWQLDVMVGLGLALSSTAFVMQMLSDSGETASLHGRVSFAILLLQDMAVVPLLAIIPILAGSQVVVEGQNYWLKAGIRVGLLAVIFVVGKFVLPLTLRRMARRRNTEGFNLFVFLGVLGAAWIMDQAGLSMALGAFIMGMLLSDSVYRYQVESVIYPYKRALLGLFFLSVGMSMDITLFRSSAAVLLLYVVVLIVMKWSVLVLLSRMFGSDWVTSFRVGFLLSQAGEFGFVLFGFAASQGGLEPVLFNRLVLVISISMVLTPVMAKAGEALTKWSPGRALVAETPEVQVADVVRHVIVGGFGRVGRTVCQMLRRGQIPYIAFDNDPRVVEAGRKSGHPVYYGDIGNQDTLLASGCGQAAMLVITVDGEAAAERAISRARNFHPGLPVQARARDLDQADKLLALGANHVELDLAESTLGLGGNILLELGMPQTEVDELIGGYRRDEYAALRREEEEAAPGPSHK